MPGREFYLWQVPSFTARVALDLVDGVSRALSDPRHKQGEELGGVLFGRILQPGNIEITRFEFIHSEHHRGTIFALGLRERDRIVRHLVSMHDRTDVHPIGFFRTHLRPGLFLDQDDFALMTEAFADPSQVALLIRPAESGPPAAGFFIWEDGDIDRRQALFAFPFDSESLRSQGPVETQQTQPPKSALSGIHIPVPHISKALLGWSTGAVAAMTVLALGMQYRPAPAPPQKEVERRQSDSGARQMEVSHQDVAGSSAPQPETALAKPSPVPPPAVTLSTRQTVSKRIKKAAPKVDRTLIAAAPAPAPPLTAPEPEPKAVVEPRTEPAPAPSPSIPVHTRSVAVSIRVEPRQSSELKKVVSRLPLLGRSFHAEGGTDFSPARPTRPLEPQVPQILAEDLSQEVSVDVKVSIDKHGSVKNAHVLNGGQSQFATLAANTAEATSWEPARQGDRTVSSDVIVHYRFSPAQ
jgi:hypothetical protein